MGVNFWCGTQLARRDEDVESREQLADFGLDLGTEARGIEIVGSGDRECGSQTDFLRFVDERLEFVAFDERSENRGSLSRVKRRCDNAVGVIGKLCVFELGAQAAQSLEGCFEGGFHFGIAVRFEIGANDADLASSELKLAWR